MSDEIKLRPALSQAFDAITDDDSDVSMEQRFLNLLHQFTANAFFIMDRQKRTGNRITDAEKEFQQDCMNQMNFIDKYFRMAKKNGFIADTKPRDTFDRDLLAEIRKQKSTIGEIVRTLPDPKKTE